jgi:peptide/nickel transport system ATP-binding protein
MKSNKKVMVEFKDVCKYFPKQGGFLKNKKELRAVNNANFDIYKGDALAIVGESGCGKTTMARMLIKLHEVSSGQILVDGKDITKHMSKQEMINFRSIVQMIFQDPFGSLNVAHKAKNIIKRAVEIHNKHMSKQEIEQRIVNLFEQVGLTPAKDYMEKYPNQLSGGQRQRIVIARALAANPSIIVADEPTSMLDVSIGIDIMNLMIDLKKNKDLTFMYITHNLASARYMAERIVVMYAGSCVEVGDMESVINKPLHPYTTLLLASTPEPFRDEEIEINASEEMPDLTDNSSRCMFCERCPKAMDICKRENPPTIDIGTRKIKCFLYDENYDESKPSLVSIRDFK